MFQPYEALYDFGIGRLDPASPWLDTCQRCGMRRIMHGLEDDHWFDPVVVTPVVENS